MSNGVAFDFSNTSALVTGGTSGIGLAVASAFSEAGASVTITGTKPSAGDYEVDLTRFAYRQLQMRDPQSVGEIRSTIAARTHRLDKAGRKTPERRNPPIPLRLGVRPPRQLL